jgi:hypothetical protein
MSALAARPVRETFMPDRVSAGDSEPIEATGSPHTGVQER